ncbi:MAG TPA: lysophospholipid acyltransferase family protein [Thermoanaerobaculia bacterium]|nr:lysophospholipid acyltransferase family protein [Thermoanaerobaculia bacterium]
MARRSRLREFRSSLLASALRAVGAVGRRISLARARRWGARVGRLAWRVVPRERRKALRSLALAFPDRPEAEREAIARAMFAHLGISLFEIAWLPNLTPRLLEATTRFEGLEHLRGAAESGRGVVLFTGHCGNWEWMAAAIALAGFRMNVIARDLDVDRINDFVVASRAQFGVDTIGRGSSASARDILRTLRSGAILGVLIDQNIRAESIPVEFFGIPASTPIGPARLAIRSGALAIAGFIEREPGGTLVVRFQRPIDTSPSTDPAGLTAQMTRAIEAQIRRVPAQWVWMHQRWKERTRR